MKKKINSITLGAILASVYAILTILFSYVLTISSTFSMIILPIFAAYYASMYNGKETFLFNIVTVVVCFIAGLGNIFYTILYVIPSLIIGDVFGLLNHKNIKFYSTIFFETITFMIVNYFTIILTELFYEVEIIKIIIYDDFTYHNFALIILFIVSLAESVVTSLFINEQLKKIKIKKEVEDKYPSYGYLLSIILIVLSVIFYFINNNLYYLCTFISLLLSSISFVIMIVNKKNSYFIVIFLSLFLTFSSLLLAKYNLKPLISLLFAITIFTTVIINKYVIIEKRKD